MNNSIVMKILRSIKYLMETIYLMGPYIKFIENNLASHGISLSREKMRSSILMQAHVIEKGLSLSYVKPWFGQSKIVKLIGDTKDYYTKFNDQKILYWVVSILQAYMDFNKGNKDTPTVIIEQFYSLKSLLGDYHDENLKGGFVMTQKQTDLSDFDYYKFVSSRHSVRSFTGETIDISLIHEALRIAETTPSACNRQPWYNYVITGKSTILDILSIQRGSRQFKEQVAALIITASSAHFFFKNEFNQMYFNSGLYAMNLLFALHAEGLGTIPLNMGLGKKELDSICKICGIPSTQMPISMIAIGVLPKEYKYAKSARFSYRDYTVFVDK